MSPGRGPVYLVERFLISWMEKQGVEQRIRRVSPPLKRGI
jgi:hypothetical protein